MRAVLARYFGRRDVMLLVIVAIVLAVGYVALAILFARAGGEVRVTVDGAVYGTYSLAEDRTIPITVDGTVGNTLVIEDGHAYMADATCPDRLCVHQSAIDKRAQSIVCLPHRVIVTVTDGADNSLDSMTR